MANGEQPHCGWQVPGNSPAPFDWWVIGLGSAVAGIAAYIHANGIPVISGIISSIAGTSAIPSIGTTGAAAGALAVLALVAYYLLQPDGCLPFSKPKSENVCCSGIVDQITDGSSGATTFWAPFAVGPSYIFDVVVKSVYLYLVRQNADFIICSPEQVHLLRCVVKNEISCGARIGAMIGAAAAAVGGIIVGWIAGGALLAALACGPLVWLCVILALIVAAIVAAAITYAGAMVGGWIGAGIASIGEDQVEETAGSLVAGAVVTVRGDWTKNSKGGFNELFYVTALMRTGKAEDVEGIDPPYDNLDADDTANDDCPLAPPVIG
ncbi:MAG: hypothetical protein IH872_09740 [Chloroflexi bacterium]|nr:hypothetical protein [Chloroflexota bacterium]